jgi:hypothetical protein
MRKIPIKGIPSQKFRVVLDEQNCTISLYYRFGNMYLDLYVKGTAIELGAIVRNRAAINKISNANFSGSLHMVDIRGNDDVGENYAEMGTRFVLLYLSGGETIPEGLRY